MKALSYHGAKDVRVDTVPDPVLQAADDIILRVTATAICGSDLHLYRGKIPQVKDGDILGHEFMGIVEEAGSGVERLKVGDRVVIPFVIACGSCFFCERTEFACCETTNSGPGAIANGNGITSPQRCSLQPSVWRCPWVQAEFVRVPHANVGPFAIPGSLDDDACFFFRTSSHGYQAA